MIISLKIWLEVEETLKKSEYIFWAKIDNKRPWVLHRTFKKPTSELVTAITLTATQTCHMLEEVMHDQVPSIEVESTIP